MKHQIIDKCSEALFQAIEVDHALNGSASHSATAVVHTKDGCVELYIVPPRHPAPLRSLTRRHNPRRAAATHRMSRNQVSQDRHLRQVPRHYRRTVTQGHQSHVLLADTGRNDVHRHKPLLLRSLLTFPHTSPPRRPYRAR